MERVDQPGDRQLATAEARLAETLDHIARLTKADAAAVPILSSGERR